ncbi:serine/threonine-protein kinase/endoribonuclease IRE1b isoform X2 [Tanacetum coccineum]
MSHRRAIVAHDGKVYIFQLNEVNAPATCLGLLSDDPLEPRPTMYFCGVAEGVKDYLDLKYASEITRMFPSRHTEDGRIIDFDGKLSSTYESYIHAQKNKRIPAASLSQKFIHGAIKYSDNLYVSRSDNEYYYTYKWFLRLANFTFSDPDIIVEYAPNSTRFLQLCYKYQLNRLFRSNAISSISIDESRTISRKGPTVVSHGTQDGRACVVKRVNVLDEKYRSDFFHAATKLYSCSDHNNIVTIYETKFDGKYCNIAMEPCTCNFVQFAADNLQENEDDRYHRLKSLVNEVALGVAHLHENGLIHGSIRASNVLVKSYRTGVVARLGRLSRSRYHESEDETLLNHNITFDAKREGWYTRDLYGVARFILEFEIGKAFVDDDKSDDGYFNTNYQVEFKNELEELSRLNGVAHDLVMRLLTTHSMSAVHVLRHHYFWPRGTYLRLIQVLSDRITGIHRDINLEKEVNLSGKLVFDGTWQKPDIDEWLNAKGGDEDYDACKLSSLLRIIRNTAHHPPEDKTWKRIGGSHNGFEDYINFHFPQLFNTVCHLAEKNNSKTSYFIDFF